MSEIKCPYCGAEDDYCISDLWEMGAGEHKIECGSCEKTIIINAEVEINYNISRPDCIDDKHDYTAWARSDYLLEQMSYWKRECKNCDNFEIIRTAYKADLPQDADK